MRPLHAEGVRVLPVVSGEVSGLPQPGITSPAITSVLTALAQQSAAKMRVLNITYRPGVMDRCQIV